MSMPTLNPRTEHLPTDRYAVLELTVNHHPGVIAQVSGLCARRAFHVEGLLYLPDSRGTEGRMWLRVPEDHRLAQVIKQLWRLEDVLDIRRGEVVGGIAAAVAAFFRG